VAQYSMQTLAQFVWLINRLVFHGRVSLRTGFLLMGQIEYMRLHQWAPEGISV